MARLIAILICLPALGLTIWLVTTDMAHPWHDRTILSLKIYHAGILAFLGGIRWGLAMRDDDGNTGTQMVLSIFPAVFGGIAIVLPTVYSFALLAVIFAALGAWDQFAVHHQKAPLWFGRLRMWMTILFVAMMIVAVIVTA